MMTHPWVLMSPGDTHYLHNYSHYFQSNNGFVICILLLLCSINARNM